MPSYEAHIVDSDGLVRKVVLMECDSDADALIAAEKLVDGHDVAVWRSAVRLGILHHADKPKPPSGPANTATSYPYAVRNSAPYWLTA
jgi:hypothetical protein